MESEHVKYMFICSHCGNKAFSNGKDLTNFTEIATASLPKRANGTNKETAFQKKKLKCDQCGYLFKIVQLTATKPLDEEEKTNIKE